MATKHYYEVGYRLTRQQREQVKAKGFHVYATRSWDEGTGSTLEHRVLVNHETDVIMDFEALDENNPDARIDDYYQYLDDNNVEYGKDIAEKVRDILAD